MKSFKESISRNVAEKWFFSFFLQRVAVKLLSYEIVKQGGLRKKL